MLRLVSPSIVFDFTHTFLESVSSGFLTFIMSQGWKNHKLISLLISNKPISQVKAVFCRFIVFFPRILTDQGKIIAM